MSKELFKKMSSEGEWQPISSFNGETFTIMTAGIPDCTEVIKYKGTVPEWAKYWMPLPQMPKQ